jgi:pyruvate kinase
MDVIATIRPAAPDRTVLDLLDAGATVLRLNGARTSVERAARALPRLRALVNGRARLMIDLPGNKVRVVNLPAPIAFVAGGRFALDPGHFSHPELCAAMRPGDEVTINDGRTRLSVAGRRRDAVVFVARDAGTLANHRGLVFQRTLHPPDFPLLSAPDRALLELANEHAVDMVGVSFVRHPRHRDEVLSRVGDPRQLVYKIETREAAAAFESLVEPGECALLDRGDVAGEIGWPGVPGLQKRLTAWAAARGIHLHVATGFLISMERRPLPSASEVHALYETIAAGVSGIQLSEETARGRFPLHCIRVVREVERHVRADQETTGPPPAVAAPTPAPRGSRP